MNDWLYEKLLDTAESYAGPDELNDVGRGQRRWLKTMLKGILDSELTAVRDRVRFENGHPDLQGFGRTELAYQAELERQRRKHHPDPEFDPEPRWDETN